MRSAAKLLRFPLGGIAKNGSYRDTTYPTEESVYSTPVAMNVIGECSFSSRMRGGSRPGLKRVEGVSTATTARWLWPNGEGILVGSGFTPWSYNLPEGFAFEVINYMGNSRWELTIYEIETGGPVALYGDGGENATAIAFTNGVYNATATRTSAAVRLVFADLASATLPDGAKLMLQHPPQAVYRNRLVKAEGSVWMASRTGDFGDFDFGGEADDQTRPVAGNLADAGREGEPITAIAALGDQRLFVATRRRLCLVQNEPTSAWATVSTNVGIISTDAWCNADGTFYFMGQNGLYGLGESGVAFISGNIPDDLKGLASALLVYDPHYRGIHIFTPRADYFYDVDNRAFWPVSYPSSMRPTAGAFGVVDNVNRVVFLCSDGQYRYWDDAQTTDDGTPISSSVAIGPFKCGVNEGDGMLDEIDVTLANGSSQVNVSVTTAHTAESAAVQTENAPAFAFTTGYNPPVRTRHRGAWATLFLTSTGRWAYESIYARIKTLGRLRP